MPSSFHLAVQPQIQELAQHYAQELARRTEERIQEMENDNTAHYLLYAVLGVSVEEGKMIDLYQNKGRFLYNYAGKFLERAVLCCFQARFPEAASMRIPNSQGLRPKEFEIDCVIGQKALEIKWRDATTDGDHITKEHTRINAIRDYGLIPIRLMFFMPNREQALRVQKTLKTLYLGIGGEYYAGDEAWKYLAQKTSIDLKAILENLTNTRV
ncbi:MAG: ApaLI family restriction endonuclease [Candidatus Kapabacteria bacterium]|jgi:hypothetical protein|nr:ApaLI family restriction endonuclease [Candidatus Kapabacteria bacterium]